MQLAPGRIVAMGAIAWRKAGVYVLIVVPVLGSAGITVIAKQNQETAAQQQGVDPVADAARKARQQKKDAPKPKKVFTNEDVSTTTPSSGSSAPAPSAAATAPSTSDAKDNASGQAGSGDAASGDKSATPAKNDEATW